MQALIIEDERLSADRLKVLIQKIDPDIEVLATLDSVNSSRLWFKDNSPPDILFLDIQLNDGLIIRNLVISWMKMVLKKCKFYWLLLVGK